MCRLSIRRQFVTGFLAHNQKAPIFDCVSRTIGKVDWTQESGFRTPQCGHASHRMSVHGCRCISMNIRACFLEYRVAGKSPKVRISSATRHIFFSSPAPSFGAIQSHTARVLHSSVGRKSQVASGSVYNTKVGWPAGGYLLVCKAIRC